jgi:DNA replication and repair protein RecF
LFLQQLILTQFKNYSFQKVDFSAKLNCLVGMNGMGKTNLLDAIYYLCMTKSHFTHRDRYVVQQEQEFFRLEGHFQEKDQTEKVVAKVIPNQKKVFEYKDTPYDKLAEHIGRFPVVIIAPDDTSLAREGSEERRRFLDNTLSQLDQEYLAQLLLYNKLLKQRNAFLKQWEGRRFDPALLEVYDQQLVGPAKAIHAYREAFLADFVPLFKAFYKKISNSREEVGCRYRSQLADEADYLALLHQNAEKDQLLQRTTTGIHRDDLVLIINGEPVKRFASQGQLKSFVLALKLAQYEQLKQKKNRSPLLLLDDIFDKLDTQRVSQLLELILEADFGQIFITDTDEDRIRKLTAGIEADTRIFIVENGAIKA